MLCHFLFEDFLTAGPISSQHVAALLSFFFLLFITLIFTPSTLVHPPPLVSLSVSGLLTGVIVLLRLLCSVSLFTFWFFASFPTCCRVLKHLEPLGHINKIFCPSRFHSFNCAWASCCFVACQTTLWDYKTLCRCWPLIHAGNNRKNILLYIDEAPVYAPPLLPARYSFRQT